MRFNKGGFLWQLQAFPFTDTQSYKAERRVKNDFCSVFWQSLLGLAMCFFYVLVGLTGFLSVFHASAGLFVYFTGFEGILPDAIAYVGDNTLHAFGSIFPDLLKIIFFLPILVSVLFAIVIVFSPIALLLLFVIFGTVFSGQKIAERVTQYDGEPPVFLQNTKELYKSYKEKYCPVIKYE